MLKGSGSHCAHFKKVRYIVSRTRRLTKLPVSINNREILQPGSLRRPCETLFSIVL